jgi:hypothetical protein
LELSCSLWATSLKPWMRSSSDLLLFTCRLNILIPGR